jgi:hypothetical protein
MIAAQKLPDDHSGARPFFEHGLCGRMKSSS